MDRFEHEVAVRYSDLDAYGHVNNATYGTYCEEARIAYLEEVLDVGSVDEFPAVVASLDVDFRSPVTEPTSVRVSVRVSDIGESSLTMTYELDQDGTLVADAETTLVALDPTTGDARSIPDDWRERVAEFDDLHE